MPETLDLTLKPTPQLRVRYFNLRLAVINMCHGNRAVGNAHELEEEANFFLNMEVGKFLRERKSKVK